MKILYRGGEGEQEDTGFDLDWLQTGGSSLGITIYCLRELRMEDTASFFNFIRMQPEMFDELLLRVGPRIQNGSGRNIICTRSLYGLRMIVLNVAGT